MADVVVTDPPFIVQHPLIKIGATGSSLEISCPATHVTLEPDQDENTVETFCGIYTSYKPAKWTLTATIAMNYGPTGLWDALFAMAGTIQPFQVQPDNGAASADNPNWSGEGYVRYVSAIDADPGGVSEVDLVIAVQGALTSAATAPTTAAAASSSSSSE